MELNNLSSNNHHHKDRSRKTSKVNPVPEVKIQIERDVSSRTSSSRNHRGDLSGRQIIIYNCTVGYRLPFSSEISPKILSTLQVVSACKANPSLYYPFKLVCKMHRLPKINCIDRFFCTETSFYIYIIL